MTTSSWEQHGNESAGYPPAPDAQAGSALGLEKIISGEKLSRTGSGDGRKFFLATPAAQIGGLSRRHSQDNLKGGSSPPTSSPDPALLEEPSPGTLPKARGQARA